MFQFFVKTFNELFNEFIFEIDLEWEGAMAEGELCWGKAIIDDSKVAEITAIEEINGKRVFAGVVVENIKSTVISGRTSSGTTTKSVDEEAKGVSGIKDDLVSGSGWLSPSLVPSG